MTYLPILTYHRLLAEEPSKTVDPMRIAVSQSQFRRHLAWLKRLGYRTVQLTSYVRDLQSGRSPGARCFAITFDDAYEEVFSLGLSVLREFGFSATVFAVADLDNNQWDKGTARLMSVEQLRQWQKAGMDVGSHGCHHVHLPQVSLEEARREIRDSKIRLEKKLGQAVSLLAYPYGESNSMIEGLAREAGYEAAFATDRVPGDHAANLYRLRRAVIFPRNTIWEVLCKAQRWYPAYQDWKRKNS